MKFVWEKPDKSEVDLDHPDEIVALMNEIKSRYRHAVAAGKDFEAAALLMEHKVQFKQWHSAMAWFYLDKQKKLNEFVNRNERVLAWWKEWSASTDQTTDVSELQTALLADLPGDLRPGSWEKAARIINHHPRYRVPSFSIAAAIELLTKVITIAREFCDETGKLKAKYYEGNVPEQDMLDRYEALSAELQSAISNLKTEG